MISSEPIIARPAVPGAQPGQTLPAGPAGPSAYQVAVAAGYVGSISDWLASLRGVDADLTQLNTAVAEAGAAAVSAVAKATAAAASASDAEVAADAAGASATTAGAAASSATAEAATAGTAATSAATSAVTAQAWACSMAGTVDGASYSARYYAAQAAASAQQAASGRVTPAGPFTVGHVLVAVDAAGLQAQDGGPLGSMAQQPSFNVAVTGGAIDGAVIGGKTPASGKFTSLVVSGSASVPDVAANDSSGSAANTRFVAAAIAALIASSPAALDTLKELADALGDDPNFAATVNTAIAARLKRAGDQMTGALDFAPAVTVASAATTPIGAAASNMVAVSGTTAITAFDSAAESVLRYVRFASAGLVLTYGATSIQLPGAASITTQAGDHAIFRSLGPGNGWRCLTYQRADGTPLVSLLPAAAGSDVVAGTSTSKTVTPKSLYDAQAFVALTDAATVAVDLSNGINFALTLGGNRTLGAPTNAKVGSGGVIRLLQDATGSRTLAFSSAWDFGAAGAPTLQTAAGKEDLLSYIVVDAAAPRLRAVFAKGA